MQRLLLSILIFTLIVILAAGCAAEYEVSVNVEPEHAAEIDGSGTYTQGDTATIRVRPSEEYDFVGWIEDDELVSEDEEYEFKVLEDKEVKAVLEIRKHEIDVSVNDEEMGAVRGGGTYEYGEEVTIEAEPEEGYEFRGWVEDGQKVSEDGEYEFEVEQDTNLVAVYDIDFDELVLTDYLTGYLLPMVENGAFGFINADGEVVIEPNTIINQINPSPYYTTPIYVDDKNPLVLPLSMSGREEAVIINSKGQVIGRHPEVTSVLAGRPDNRFPDVQPYAIPETVYNNHGVIAFNDGQYGFVDHNGNQILEFRYEDITAVPHNEAGFLEVSQDGQKGIFDSKRRKKLLDVGFDEIEGYGWLDHGRFKAEKKRDTYLFDLQGEMVAEIDCDEIDRPSSGLAAVRRGEDWGFIDMDGEMVIEPQFEEQYHARIRAWHRWVEGFYSPVKYEGKWGVIDSKGDWLLEPQFEEMSILPQGFQVRKDSAEGFVHGRDVNLFPSYNWRQRQYGMGDYVCFKEEDGDKLGILSICGEVLKEPVFDACRLRMPETCNPATQYIARDYATFEKDGYWAVFHEGEFVAEFKFAEIRDFQRPMEYSGVIQMIARDDEEESWGLYDVKKGEYIVPPGEYDDVDYLIENRVRIKRDRKYGFLDEAGHLVVEHQYDDTTSFANEVAVVRSESELQVLDRKGKDVVEPVQIEPGEQDISLYYFEDADVYRTINFGYFCTDEGWIRKPQ